MKAMLVLALMAMFGISTASAQKTVVAQKNQEVFNIVEQMPEYPGGQAALFEYLSKNIKYPEDAQKKKVEGNVIVSFIVETDGSISEVKVEKQVFSSLDAEAVRVISSMPKWKPGKQKGQFVRVHFVVPIAFRLK